MRGRQATQNSLSVQHDDVSESLLVVLFPDNAGAQGNEFGHLGSDERLPQAQGQGYATEAAGALLEAAFWNRPPADLVNRAVVECAIVPGARETRVPP